MYAISDITETKKIILSKKFHSPSRAMLCRSCGRRWKGGCEITSISLRQRDKTLLVRSLRRGAAYEGHVYPDCSNCIPVLYNHDSHAAKAIVRSSGNTRPSRGRFVTPGGATPSLPLKNIPIMGKTPVVWARTDQPRKGEYRMSRFAQALCAMIVAGMILILPGPAAMAQEKKTDTKADATAQKKKTDTKADTKAKEKKTNEEKTDSQTDAKAKPATDDGRGVIELKALGDRYFSSAVFSPDGKLVATVENESVTAVIWERNTGKQLRTLKHDHRISDIVAFSPDGKMIATSTRYGNDTSLAIWDIETGNKKQVIECKNDLGGFILFSPNGKLLLTYDYGHNRMNGYLIIWSIKEGIPLKTFDRKAIGSDDLMRSVKFSADGKRLICFYEGNGRIVDIATGNLVFDKYLHVPEGKNSDRQKQYGYEDTAFLAFSQDGTKVYQVRLGYEYSKSKPIFDTTTGKLLAFGEEANKMMAKQVLPEKSEVDPEIRRAAMTMSPRSAGSFGTFTASSGLGSGAEDKGTFFGKDYEFYAAGKYTKTIGCYEIATGKTLFSFNVHAQTDLAWETFMQSEFQDFAKRTLKKEIPGPKGLRWNPLYFAETTSGEWFTLTKFDDGKNETYGVTFVKDGKTPGKTIPVEPTGKINLYYSHFSPDHKYLWTSRGRDYGFEVYDLRTGKSLGIIQQPYGEFTTKLPTSYSNHESGCVFSPDGESFLIGARNANDGRYARIIQIWDIKSVKAANKQQSEQKQDVEKLLLEALE